MCFGVQPRGQSPVVTSTAHIKSSRCLPQGPLGILTPKAAIRRRLRYWHRRQTAIKSEPSALADVVREAPRLLDFLPADAWSALSGTNRQLRQLVHSYTKSVHLDSKYRLDDLCKGDWPQLEMVLIPKRHWYSTLDWKPDSTIQLIAALGFAKKHWYEDDDDTLTLVVRARPKQQSKWPVVQLNLPPTVLSRLYRPQWTQTQHLELSNSQLSASGIAQLTALPWPNLRTLSVNDNNLGSPEIAHLAQGSWPQLKELDLSKNQLDAAATAQLALGAWPLLERLCLGHNQHLDALAIAQLANAPWPRLTYLSLQAVKLDAPALHELAHLG